MQANVTMYVLSWCGYCHAAKRLLTKKGVEYEVIDSTGNQEMRARLLDETGSHTLPQIFIGGTPIGGYTELKALADSGQLDQLLQA